ncbi:hypothetical protein PSENEW3_00001175 [Picochlorum sp. SENEW3]|nr:hypothetical protein PSENEW3_00001175 [Picochlorum sp. SENEW3]
MLSTVPSATPTRAALVSGLSRGDHGVLSSLRTHIVKTKDDEGVCRPVQRVSQVSVRSPYMTARAVRADEQGSSVEDAKTVQIISNVMNAVELEWQTIADEMGVRIAAAGEDVSEGEQELRHHVIKSIEMLQAGLLERDMEVRLMLLAALCGEHLLLLGPPGTAKSELSRRLSSLTGGVYFERLLTRFSVPEELFGPLSIKGLEQDEYTRKTDGYLPTAEVAFIDEIFKANSAILNALLTLLNERLFDNGAERLPVPLLCLVGASNELPESEELDALYDRFLIRKSVDQVSKGQLANLARLASGGMAPYASSDDHATYLSLDDFKYTGARAIEAVDISDEMIDLLTELRNYLQDKCEPPIYVSDRRFMKAVNLMQVAAYADGRSQVSESDCLLLEYVMGNKPDDSEKVRRKVLDILASDIGMQQCELLFLGLFGRSCNALEQGDGEDIAAILNDCRNLNDILVSRLENVRESVELDFPHLKSSIWLSNANVNSAIQFLSPHAEENKSKLEDMVKETLILQNALANKVEGGILEKLLPKRFKQYQKGIADKA